MRQGFFTVFHLLATDLRSLRFLVLVAWLLMLLSALPSLIATPDDFNSLPNRFETSSSQFFDEEIDALRAERDRFASWGNTKLANYAVLVLALAIGCVNRGWGSERPLRSRHRAVAKLVLLFGLVILPQLALITLNLLGLGFSPNYVAAGFGSASAAFLPLLIGALCFGLLCGSPWRCLVGVTLIFVAAGVIELFYRGAARHLLSPLLDTWGTNAGPRRWWCLGLSAAALLVLCAAGGLRWRPRFRVLGACGAVVLSWLATRSLSDFRLLEAAPIANSVELPTKLKTTAAPNPDRSGVRLMGELGITEQGDGDTSAIWYALASPKLYADGRLLATSVPLGNSVNTVFPQQESEGFSASLLDYLPEGTTIVANPTLPFSSFGLGRSEQFVGEFEIPSCDELLDAGETFELEGEAGGIVYRYDIGFDVELHSEAQRVEVGAVTLHIKQLGGVPLADIITTRPSIGASQHYADLNWRFESGSWHIYYYLPHEGVVVGSARNYEARAPLVAGAGAERWVYEPKVIHRMSEYGRPSASAGDLNFDGVRIIGVRAEVVGTARRPFRIPVAIKARSRHNNDNYYMAKDYRVDPNAFFMTYRDQRPDPRTASPEELGHWMRTSFTQTFVNRWMEHDLAQFAPRHTPTLLRLPGHSTSRHQAWGRAIAIGAPESERDRVIGALGSVKWLPAVLAQRGWLGVAREELLEQWEAGHERSDEFLRAIIYLEASETYPQLVEHVRRGHIKPKIYESLRELPGIEPELSDAISDWVESVRGEGDHTAFLVPAMHGDREGMALLVERVREKFKEYKVESLGSVFAGAPARKQGKAWVDSFDPEEWVWDPVARLWIKADQKS